MTRKVYRTAQGKMVDIGALQLRNENVRAVGNMPVNARGDIIDSNNRAIEARTQQVAKNYRRQTSNVDDSSVYGPRSEASKKPKELKSMPTENPVAKTVASTSTADTIEKNAKPLTGLAAAIAKARQIKQEELTTPQQVAAHQHRRTEG